MKYDAVLLDMDGTVLDTLEDIADAVNATLRHFSLPQISYEAARASLGNGAGRLVQRSVPEGSSPELTEQVLHWYMPYYDAHCRVKTKPYDGITALMERLRAQGVRLAVVSNKQDSAVNELGKAFFPGLLDCTVGERASVRRKPCPDTVLAAAKVLDTPPERCVYVGDSEVDVETAANAGMDCVAVCWGFRSREQLEAAGASKLAETVDELYALLTEQ